MLLSESKVINKIILVAYTRQIKVVYGKNSTLCTSNLCPCHYVTPTNNNNISYLIKGVTTRKSSIDLDKIIQPVDEPPKSRFDIQALRETEREYHRIQITFKVLRDDQRRRSTSIRLQRARSSSRRRVITNYKHRYRQTNKGIR